MWQRGEYSGSCEGGRREAWAQPRVFMSKKNSQNDEGDLRGGIVTKTEPKTKRPSLYKVLLLNDDYTTMDFVIEVLETIFNKQPAEAFRIMMMVHTQGKGLCGVYPHEIAETKVEAVITSAREHGFPLKAAMEPE